MGTQYTDTAYLGNTVSAIPRVFIKAQDIPMGYLDRLAEIRKRKGLTQAQVAELVGVEQPTYQRWEKGKREPSFGQLFELARVLSVDPSSLIDHSIAANMEILDEMAERRRHQELLDAINSKKIP